jgi:DNA invertase Pin-like site-specific DNA recombinase
MKYGYARVSTDGQSVDAQVKALRAAGAEKVFMETASGASSDRAQLRRALAALGKGDVLLVTRLDRLARSTRDLIRARTGEGRSRTKARGVHMGRPPKLTRHQREEACAILPKARPRKPTSRGGSMFHGARFRG